MAQTTYSTSYSSQPAGLLADDGGFRHIETKANGEAVNIPFGVGVVEGATVPEVLLPTVLSAGMTGVVVRTAATEAKGAVVPDRAVNVMKAGLVYVKPETDVTLGQQAFMRVTVSGSEQAGAFRNDTDSGDAVAVNAFFMDTGLAGTAVRMMVVPRASLLAGADFSGSLVHASLTATTTDFLITVPTGKVFVVDAVQYYNATGLAADVSNYFALTIQNSGATKVAASWSTQTSAQGAITAATPVSLVNGTLANRTFTAGEIINFVATEAGSATLPAGRILVLGRFI